MHQVISHGTGLLQVRDSMNCGHDEVPDNPTLCPIAFASESLSSTEWHYSNKECEALEIIHKLDNFHLYPFAREVKSVTNHKLLVAILCKDVTTLSQWLQCIMP